MTIISTTVGRNLRIDETALIVNKRVWNAYLDAISKTTEWSLFFSKVSHAVSQQSKSMPKPVILKKVKLNSSMMKDLQEQTPLKIVLFIIRCLECKSRKSRNTCRNKQIWPWSTGWNREKAHRVLPREPAGHSKHPLPTTQEKPLHLNITRWSILKTDWLYSLQPKMEKLYTVSKMIRSWLWFISWTSYCKIQT